MKNLNVQGDAELNNNQINKFELVNCPQDCTNCKLFLFEINRLFHESEQYQVAKEYQFSVISLKKAFEKTFQLISPVEQQCADLFRFTIIESLENIHQELKRMTKGFFRSGRYKRSLMMSEETLKEFRQIIATGKESKIQGSSDSSKDKKLNLPAV
jgi:hypothetical protein